MMTMTTATLTTTDHDDHDGDDDVEPFGGFSRSFVDDVVDQGVGRRG